MRIETADRLKGLCIILMIVGHCLIPNALHDAIYLFHIPMFFFIAGFFFKPAPIGKRLRSDARRLLLPYVVCILLVVLRYGIDALRIGNTDVLVRFLVSSVVVGPDIDFSKWTGLAIGPIWFLCSLFWCRTILNLLLRFRYGVVVSMLIGVGCCCVGQRLHLPFGLMQGMTGLFFACAGYLAGNHREIFQRRRLLPVAIVCALPAVFIPSMDMNPGLFPYYVLNLVVSLAACCLLWNAFYVTEASTFKGLAFLSWAGRFSLLVLMVHYFEFMTFYWYEKFSFMPAFAVALVRVCIDLAVSFGLSKITFIRKFCIL